MLLALVAPLTLLSETRLKEAVETVFGGCLFVLEVADTATVNQVEVRGYMTGKTPDSIDLTFRTRGELINKLRFRDGILVEPATAFSSLLLHPLAGQTCPGKLCEAPQTILKPTETMTIRLPYPSANFDYRFTAELSEPAKGRSAAGRLVVFSIADATKASTCRVEGPNPFNVMARLDKLQRFGAYCAILLAGTLLVMTFKRWGDKP
ncbi:MULTISPECIES: hypothetical protein [unclassified Rhizobacter]|uniref:hypothetical protein n=1 Tax=unclassified Rhizobacter TaxID=2640088 RepID=UPI0007001948|nr:MULTISPECIES: hypothetical protein [unclassified Rhizobacter]KQU80821.1 hypothetical protein ASC88_14830 [Rhizobacter sp. Root29]KQW04364.1 hypothetical protein ASC98_04520 [Rhizobacter sp. Root1238]KRB14505.1 hypothetical protein ASE08_08620 [Rhizobacter sp. Root16D2]